MFFFQVLFLVLQSQKTEKGLPENNIKKNIPFFASHIYMESFFWFCKFERPKKDYLGFFFHFLRLWKSRARWPAKKWWCWGGKLVSRLSSPLSPNHLHNKKEKGNKSQLMNMTTSKNTMSALHTQLTLIAYWCLLEVATKSSRKSHERLREKKIWKTSALEQCA